MVIILSILWGGSFFFVEVALTRLPPFTLVLGRVGLARPMLVLLVYWVGQRMPRAPGPAPLVSAFCHVPAQQFGSL